MSGNLNKELDLTLRLGMRSMFRLGFDIEPKPFKRMGMSYELWHNIHQDINTCGKSSDNISYIYQKANVKLFSFDAMNFNCELGMGWEHYHIIKGLWNDNSMVDFNTNEHYFNYHVNLRYNNEDNHYFTRRGTRAEVNYAYYTNNFIQWHGHSGFSAVSAMWQTTVSLAENTQLRPRLQGRLLFGEDLPIMKSNVVGGMTYGKFFPQQLPLEGFGNAEFFDSKFLSASLQLQQRLTGRHYLLLDGSVAENNDTLGDIFDRKPIWGTRIAYFYNSGILGPMGASLGWSSHTHRVNFYVSLGFDF